MLPKKKPEHTKQSKRRSKAI